MLHWTGQCSPVVYVELMTRVVLYNTEAHDQHTGYKSAVADAATSSCRGYCIFVNVSSKFIVFLYS